MNITDSIARDRLTASLNIAAQLPELINTIAKSDDSHHLKVTLERLELTKSLAATVQERLSESENGSVNMENVAAQVRNAMAFLKDDNNSVMAYTILRDLLKKIA